MTRARAISKGRPRVVGLHDTGQPDPVSRPGFKVSFCETIEEFYLAEALEYIHCWKQSTPENPCGICGPIGPTEQLPLVLPVQK